MYTSPILPSQAPRLPHDTPIVFTAARNLAVCGILQDLLCDTGWQVRPVLAAHAALLPIGSVPSCLVFDLSDLEAGDSLWDQCLHTECSETPVICVADHTDVSVIVCAMKAGALDVLAKPVQPTALVTAIRHALACSAATLQRGLETRDLQERYAQLSSRERQVMALVVSGLLNKQVGGELGISEITVKAHRGRVMQKMKAGSLANLVRIAAKLDLKQTSDLLQL